MRKKPYISDIVMVVALGAVIFLPAAFGKEAPARVDGRESTAAQIDYRGFEQLTDELAAYRNGRLISLREFKTMADARETLILDARSGDAYARGHIEGAVNLPFTDFTAESLARVIGHNERPILIYCNNNFSNDAPPVILKRVELALNIPTFINLYGYGYRNVYELGDVVDFNDPAVEWVTS